MDPATVSASTRLKRRDDLWLKSQPWEPMNPELEPIMAFWKYGGAANVTSKCRSGT
jgi:hypothetical protein